MLKKTTLAVLLLGAACLPIWAQRGGKPSCKSLSGHITLSDDTEMQIRSDGLGPYVDGQGAAIVTLFNCPGESGDAVINLLMKSTTRRIERDFRNRVPVLPTDDPAPAWHATAPIQLSRGGFNIRHILKGYDAATGYAPGFPVESCWNGSNFAAVCEFTTTATSNFDATDKKDYYLRFQNLNPDLEDQMNPDVQQLLNAEYALALIRVRYKPDSVDRRRDTWEAWPIPSAPSGEAEKHVGGLYESSKGVIRRLGYFDMNFHVTVRRVDGQ